MSLTRTSVINFARFAVSALMLGSASSGRAADYFAGRTIKVVVGFGPGSAYALYGELAVQHLRRFIPGNPNLTIAFMPGAAGMIALNYLYEVAPRDGTVIGVPTQDLASQQALGTEGIRYNAARFHYLARATANIPVHMVWHTAPATSFEDIKTREIVTGASFVNGTQADLPRAENALLGTRWKIIAGYQSDATMMALERGEIQAAVAAATLFNEQLRPWREQGLVKIVVQYSNVRHPLFPNVPTVLELAPTEETKRIFNFLLSLVTVGRSYLAPPETPSEAVTILRNAFTQMLDDPEFRADAARKGADILPASGEELAEHVKGVVETPPAVIDRVREVIRPR